MYLLAPFILQVSKKFIEPIQSYEDVPFSGPKWPICCEQNFFGTNHYYYFPLSIGPFPFAKFKKILDSQSRVKKMRHFWAQNGPFAPQKSFFWKMINIILIYLLAPSIVQNF